MTSDQEMARIVRSWLEPGLTTLTDDVLDAVLDQLPATPQRRPWWSPRRSQNVSPFAKFSIAAAALVVIAIVGFNLLAPGGVSDIGGIAASPRSSPTADAFPPSPPATIPPPLGDLEPGTYRSYSGSWFTFTVPTGWTGSPTQFVASKGGHDAFDNTTDVTMVVSAVTHVYSDSCNWTGTLVEARTPTTLVESLSAQRGHEMVGPTDATLGGYPATRFEFSVPSDFDKSVCDDSIIRLWPDTPDGSGGLPIEPGQTTTVYVVDLDGKGRVVSAIRRENSSAADVAELEAVVDSLQFEP